MIGKRETAGIESVDSLRRRIEELERWFQRQDRQIRSLERERQKLSALVNHTDAGCLVFDSELSVQWLNNVCRAWFGAKVRPGSDRAARCNELLCGSRQICRECPAARALATATVSHLEVRLDLEDAARDIYATAMPIRAPDNRVDECILMLQDITDLEVLRRSQEALLLAKESAESANRAKSEFLANMSHEVRTPMTGIMSMSSLLLETPLSNDQREYLSIIQCCGESLLAIINDILDFSRIEAGRLLIDPIAFDLTAAVDEVVTLVAEKAEEKGIELIVRYAPNVPRRVVGDAGRIRQALMNLVANAIKFTHEGHVLINVERLGGDEASVRLRLSVEDTGIGIAPDKLRSVFEKFTQADGSITRRYGGTGLGLTISKQLVELMEGEISAASIENVGSTFSFTLTLPLDLDGPAPPPVDNLENLRILVLHPHEKARAVLVEQIASWKARGHGVATGSETIVALRAAQDAGEPFHIAIVAHDVADLTPESLALGIRSDPALGSMALVLLTRLGPHGEVERLQAIGFDAYLTGPSRPSQLANVLSTVWSINQNGGRETPAVSRETGEADGAEAPAPGDDFVRAHILLAEDNLVNQRATSHLLKRLGCRVDVAATGREAIEKLAADRYDLVLMDCQMPEMDGYEATREIRRRESQGQGRTTIVALTAHTLPGDRARCLEAGMDDFLAKPVRREILSTVIGRHVPRFRS